MIFDFINIYVLMKLVVKDIYFGIQNIHRLILLILLRNVLIIMAINQKKFKQIMVLNLLTIKKKSKKFIRWTLTVLKKELNIIK